MTVNLKLGEINSFLIMVVGFGFTTMLFFAIAFGIMIRTLKRIEKTQTLALAYLINPDATLDGTNSDLVIENALRQAMTEKGETQRAFKFFKGLKPLTNV